MENRFNNIIIIIIATVICYGCGENDVNSPRGITVAPDRVILDSVKNQPGKSVIYFTQPADDSFLYMKAVYNTDREKRSISASYFADSIVVEGFGREGEYLVNLYSVSPGETYSEPLEIKVHPLEPPYLTAFKKMKILPDFSGLRIITENSTNDILTFYVYRKDGQDQWREAGAIYTRKQEIKEPVRGIEAVNADFGIVVKDRWGHVSEMKEVNLTPYYEEEVNKSKINYLKIGEYEGYLAPNAGTPKNLYDGTIGNNNTFMQKANVGYDFSKPSSVTLDLSKPFTLNRMIIYGRRSGTNYSSIFSNLFPREIEIWGRNDNQVTKFDPEDDPGWTRLYHGFLTRADGTLIPIDIVPFTDADKEIAENGSEIELPIDLGSFRYISFVCIKNYSGGSSRINVAELTFFGSPENMID